jgi:hypothetical protein
MYREMNMRFWPEQPEVELKELANQSRRTWALSPKIVKGSWP